jgi:putative oxidoreductase
MIDSRTAPAGILFLRVSLGILFLAHWGLKVFVFTPAGTVAFFGSVGLPPIVAYFDLVVEFVGAIALILGIWARLAALVLVPVLLGAIITVHGPAGFFFTDKNGGWEYPAFWSVCLIVLALLGDGAFALVRTPIPFLTARRLSA